MTVNLPIRIAAEVTRFLTLNCRKFTCIYKPSATSDITVSEEDKDFLEELINSIHL